jgi:hypothetical protein
VREREQVLWKQRTKEAGLVARNVLFRITNPPIVRGATNSVNTPFDENGSSSRRKTLKKFVFRINALTTANG